MTVAAYMIARDEEAILARCLTAAARWVDELVVVDTGSTDGTIEIAREHGATVHEIVWEDFGQARTEATRLAAAHADWLLMINADDELLGLDMRDLENRSYLARMMDGGPGYTDPRLIRADVEWRFVGKTHEYMTSDEVPYPGQDTDIRATIWHHCDGARRPRKLVEDLDLLRQAHLEDPSDPRTVFYLANTLRDLGKTEQAVALYWIRAGMGGWPAEAKAAAEQAARLEAGDLTALPVPSHWPR